MSTELKVGDKVRIVGSNSVPSTIGMKGRIILIDGDHMPFLVSIDGIGQSFWYQGEFLEKVEEPKPEPRSWEWEARVHEVVDGESFLAVVAFPVTGHKNLDTFRVRITEVLE